MSELKQRIYKALEYYEGMQPSDFVLNGVVHPKRWNEFRIFMQLLRKFLEEEKKKTKY